MTALAKRQRSRVVWPLVVVLLLLAWGLRVCYLEEVPPGWRDDELINIHALSNQVLEGRFPVYYLGASGHEPLYHHLHAGVHALFGFNVLSGHILSAAFGLLSIALTYTLARRLFPGERAIAVVASAALAASFWSLMYSRTAIRHISLLPFALATIYVFWRQIDAERPGLAGWGLLGLLLAATLYTYTASRLLPLLLVGFMGYLALFHRDRFDKHSRGVVVALVVTALLVAPLGTAIVRGRSTRAIEGIGADARVTELATPIRALRNGDPRPMLASVVETLGMFHASGDPEWLYNIAGRPVFSFFGGALLWSGVAFCLTRWRQPRFFFLLPWLGLGLSPAFISTPAASLSHTIFAQPAAYLLLAVALVSLCRWLRSRGASVMACVVFLTVSVTAISVRDLRDYFIVWPERGMVRVLYRADHREVAYYLNEHPEMTDVAVGSALMGPWDRIALEVDVEREAIVPRLFNPERTLLWTAENGLTSVLMPSWPDAAPPIADFLEEGEAVSRHLTRYALPPISDSPSLVPKTRFANGLVLTGARWLNEDRPAPGREATLLTTWRVAAPLDLPAMPIVAQPPPPKTYSGSRLSVSAHVVDGSGRVQALDDGLWVDPLTLRPGDRFVQLHRFVVPADASEGPYSLQLGLYDPKTNDRWDVEGDSPVDLVVVSVSREP
jgi:4-amino-4-deoxy-L-arabinose transferase-like glycosyltransferase